MNEALVEVRVRANAISRQILNAAFKVHSTLGPGLLESTYRVCLQHELQKAGIQVQSEVALPVIYDGVRLEIGYRIDLLVDSCVLVELKAVEAIAPIHEAQLLSYMKLSRVDLGLLINFNVGHLKDGIRRFVTGSGWN